MQIYNHGLRLSGSSARRDTAQRMMAAIVVVEIPEAVQFSPEVSSIPEGHMVEILSPDRADQSFHKRVREWYIGNGLDFLDLENPKIGFPSMETK